MLGDKMQHMVHHLWVSLQIQYNHLSLLVDFLFEGDALKSFLHLSYPDWDKKLITTGFQYDMKKLTYIEGLPDTAPLLLATMDSQQGTNKDKNGLQK